MSNGQSEGGVLTTQRLEAFSDSVFAIVITLLFVDLRAPQIPQETEWRQLLLEVFKLAPKFAGVVVSFIFVAIFWVAHHQFFHTLKQTTRGLLWLNLIFLFLVCFIPFPAAIVSEFPNNETSAVFFGAALLLTGALMITLRWYAWLRNPEISKVVNEDAVRKSMRRGFLIVLINCVGIAVAVFYPLAALVIYLLTPLTLLFPVAVTVENKDEDEEPESDVEL